MSSRLQRGEDYLELPNASCLIWHDVQNPPSIRTLHPFVPSFFGLHVFVICVTFACSEVERRTNSTDPPTIVYAATSVFCRTPGYGMEDTAWTLHGQKMVQWDWFEHLLEHGHNEGSIAIRPPHCCVRGQEGGCSSFDPHRANGRSGYHVLRTRTSLPSTTREVVQRERMK